MLRLRLPRFCQLLLCATLAMSLGAAWGAAPAQAQRTGAPKTAQQLAPVTGVSSNTIGVLEAEGDSLWLGPLLTVYPEDEQRFLTADTPRLLEEDNVVFGLDATPTPGASGSTVWASLAFDTGGGTPGAAGFLFSTDGGETFTFRLPQLDAPGDTTLTYGGQTFPARAVTQVENSAVQSIDAEPGAGVVWIAGGQSGIRTSTDGGRSWTRAVLPPDTLSAVAPGTTPPFRVGAPSQNVAGFANHVGFSVLVDATGTVWAGTAAGVNRSRPEDVVGNDRAWRRFAFDRTPGGLTGNSVVAMAEQPVPGQRNPIWMATWPTTQTQNNLQRFGVTVTRDGGATFEQTLIGEQVFRFAFRAPTREGDPAAPHIYAAGESGLLISNDDGASWRTVTAFRLADDTSFLRPDADVQSVATTTEALWVATDDGLLRLPREREADLLRDDPSAPAPAWQLFRTNVSVSPQEPSESTPQVDTYAYPNPFSPAEDRVVRMRYEVPEAQQVTVEIFNFGMDRVRTLAEQQPAGEQEMVWDGTGADGLRLPNGPYFYTVEVGGTTARGKILLVE